MGTGSETRAAPSPFGRSYDMSEPAVLAMYEQPASQDYKLISRAALYVRLVHGTYALYRHTVKNNLIAIFPAVQ